MTRILGILVLAFAAPVYAQSPYVAGAIGAEIVRTSTYSGSSSGRGEAVAGAVRVGTFLAPRIGIELEMHIPGSVESSEVGFLPALEAITQDGGVTTAYAFDLLTSPTLLPRTRTQVRAMTTSALLFVRQSVTPRVDLVYLGGVSFVRVTRQYSFEIPDPAIARIFPNIDLDSVQYGAGPIVGAEARVALSEHARLVGGIRLVAPSQVVLDGWLIRPTVGVSWSF